MITVSYDQDVNMTYVKFKEGRVARTVPYSLENYEVVQVDFNEKGWVLGLEYDGRPHELAPKLYRSTLYENYAVIDKFIRQFYG